VGKANLHFRRWSFVEAVELDRNKIRIKFNPSSGTPGPFNARVEIKEDASGETYLWQNASFQADNTLSISLRSLEHPESYGVRLELDGHVAYLNHYQEEEDIPF
jgi:hypothetical protein